jgi:hypothetical protein
MATSEPRLTPPPPAHVGFVDDGAVAQSLAGLGGLPGLPSQRAPTPALQPGAPVATPGAGAAPKASPATETLARRTGALVNEVNFPGFVSQLVHGTFDAIVDAAIRQMESYADLLAAVAKTTEQFTSENVTPDQARDWLAQRYPAEVALRLPRGSDEVAAGAQLAPRGEGASPVWLAEFGLEGQELSTELMEEQLLPQVRNKIGAERHRLLATMVMLGLNRVAVKDGSISAKVMFRAAARDTATVQYAQNPDAGGAAQAGQWGARGSNTYSGVSTLVQTVNVNAQNDTNLRADLFGEVKLNFVSETLSLDKLADPQALGLIQRQAVLGARPAAVAAVATAPAVAAPGATPTVPGGPR